MGQQAGGSAGLLDLALNDEQAGFVPDTPVAIVDLRPDNDVDHAVFVFQGDEVVTFGRGWSLVNDYQAGHVYQLAVGGKGQALAV